MRAMDTTTALYTPYDARPLGLDRSLLHDLVRAGVIRPVKQSIRRGAPRVYLLHALAAAWLFVGLKRKAGSERAGAVARFVDRQDDLEEVLANGRNYLLLINGRAHERLLTGDELRGRLATTAYDGDVDVLVVDVGRAFGHVAALLAQGDSATQEAEHASATQGASGEALA